MKDLAAVALSGLVALLLDGYAIAENIENILNHNSYLFLFFSLIRMMRILLPTILPCCSSGSFWAKSGELNWISLLSWARKLIFLGRFCNILYGIKFYFIVPCCLEVTIYQCICYVISDLNICEIIYLILFS